ncbi:MAG: TIGR04211 family SH3 domain-containing protein [Desulfotignum sp.]|nr:TIGR04211 family SH3 domain-containing protein [Desulfotignum sp.]
MRVFTFLSISLILVFSGMSALGQSRIGYVTDKLVLTFRQGPGSSYQVLKTLESDTRMTILDEQENYYQVRLSSGETGWVDKQFVTFDTPKTEIIEKLKEAHAALQKQFNELSADHEQLKEKMAAVSENSEDLYQVLQKNKRLANENDALSMQVKKMKQESEQLFKTSMIKWFLAGFGVILFGWILGQTVSGRNRRRNSLLD